MQPTEITAELKREAQRLGFDLAGACPADTPAGLGKFLEWLAAGYAGEMSYLWTRGEAYSHPRHVLDGVRSVLMLATVYRTSEPAEPPAGWGRVSRYGWGIDYHQVLRERLNALAEFVHALSPTARVRGVVDTAPLLERELAQHAGLGWIGKNTLLLNRRLGSWFFLSALLTDAELQYDEPHAADHCGTCRACLDACPTGAFVDAYVLDARRCLSYTTIELRGPIPAELRTGQGDWLFGCDICQDVCPWNRRAPTTAEPAFQPVATMNPVELTSLFDLDEAEFRRRFRHTPLWRAKRRGLLRNAAIVLGNRPTPATLPALVKGLHDAEPLVRGACAWALGQLGAQAALAKLDERRALETDEVVLAEIGSALQQIQGSGH